MLFVSAKRGIPTVKNLASGGKSALGEVGVLVTLNMLQGNLLQEEGGGICPAHIVDGEYEYFTIMIPMDVFRERFESLAKSILGVRTPTRPDIVAFSIKCKRDDNDLSPLRMRLSFQPLYTHHLTPSIVWTLTQNGQPRALAVDSPQGSLAFQIEPRQLSDKDRQAASAACQRIHRP